MHGKTKEEIMTSYKAEVKRQGEIIFGKEWKSIQDKGKCEISINERGIPIVVIRG